MPKDDATSSTAPANGIYCYEQRIKGIDVTPSLVRVVDTSYKVGNCVWVKPPNAQCTTRFGSGKIDEIISPQTMLVDGVPRHVKDAHPCCASSTLEDDEEDNIQFEDDPNPLLPLWISPEMLPMDPKEGMMESAGGDGGSGEEDGNEEVTPRFYAEVPVEDNHHLSAICVTVILGGGFNRNYHTHK